MIGKSTVCEYWTVLAKHFNDDSQARLLDLLDHIIAAGDDLTDREKMLSVLGGLDSIYTFLITNISGKKCILPLD